MPFKPGEGGRPKGALNTFTKTVKTVFEETFDKLQEHETANLTAWAESNPTEFYKLSTKLLPIQLTGDADNPVAVNVTEGMTFEQLYQLKYGTPPPKPE